MSLLDDARRLTSNADWPFGPTPGGQMPEICMICNGYHDHRPDCPWLAMPRILVVLEAAEKLAAWGYPARDWDCAYCGAEPSSYSEPVVSHETTCVWQPLVAALKESV